MANNETVNQLTLEEKVTLLTGAVSIQSVGNKMFC